jgi:hypothetical protein
LKQWVDLTLIDQVAPHIDNFRDVFDESRALAGTSEAACAGPDLFGGDHLSVKLLAVFSLPRMLVELDH